MYMLHLLQVMGAPPPPFYTVRRMTEVYYSDPRRGYGQSVSSVFYKLRNTEYSDVFSPAMEQFKGEGSCGNGSAMRISPAALFGFKDDNILVEVCDVDCSKFAS